MATHTQAKEVHNPGPFRISPLLKTFFAVCSLIGIATFSVALGSGNEQHRAWPNFLLNYYFFMVLGLSGAFFTALQHVTNAYWSVTVRRIAEALMSYLPVAFVLGLVLLFFGRHELYQWTNITAMAADHGLQVKQNYLNAPFFAIRLVGAFVLWIAFSWALRSNSLAQDKSGDGKLTLANIKLSTVFLPIFAFSFTLVSFDLLMSLEPHWFSTIFGVYCFAGLFYSGLSLLAVIVISGRRQGLLRDDVVNMNHLHDIGMLMFAFTVFWGYIMFSQLMLQWYANLPEETTYYMRRFHGGWWTVSCVLFTVHFVIPFFGLLPRGAKRNESYLFKMALFMLFSQWLDVYYMVMPPFFREGPVFGWVEIGTFLGFLGFFGISVGRFLEKAPAIPLKDPRMAQCLAHTQ